MVTPGKNNPKYWEGLFMRKVILLFLMVSMIIIPMNEERAFARDLCQPIKEIFNKNVQSEEGVCQVHITRKEPQVMMMGHALSPHMMDFQLGANFQPFESKAVVIGEFALLGEEVNPVIDALRKGGIEISAVHNHMIGEFPQIYFLHFEGYGKTETLANAVKKAIGKVSYQ